MNTAMERERDYRFVVGLLAGTCLGAGLAMWLAPRAAGELRQRVTDAASDIGQRAADQIQQVRIRVSEAADEIARHGQEIRDEVADATARGAHEVERYATAAKTKPPTL